MKTTKIISGGQTGADQGGLIGGHLAGLETGGTAPKGYRTENGNDPSLKELGLVEHFSSSYPPRTCRNILDSDVTVLFGDMNSHGSVLTMTKAIKYNKPLLINPTAAELRKYTGTTINIAGNRESVSPGIEKRVIDIVREAFKEGE